MNVDYYELRRIYEEEINKNVKNKRRIYKFEQKKEQYFLDMSIKLKNGTYDGGRYNIFLVTKPKVRV